MTDRDLVEKKLARIAACIADLRRLAHPDRIESDIREQRFVEHTLQLAIQAALDTASHIVSDERLGEPQTNRELFSLLGRAGFIPPDLTRALEAMAGFRNVLVHGYDEVDLRIVVDVVQNHLGDLERFIDAVRQRL